MCKRRHIAVVLGVQRGGGSDLAEALAMLGAIPAEDPRPPAADFRAINEKLLHHLRAADDHLGLAWRPTEQDPAVRALRERALGLIGRCMADHRPLQVLEDPRACRLLSFWRPIMEARGCRASYLIALRDPMQVARDLTAQDGIPREKGLLLWLQHMVVAVLDTTGEHRVVVDTDLLRANLMVQVARLARDLGTDGTDERQSANEPPLPEPWADSPLPGDIVTVYGLLSRAARDETSLESPDVIEQFQRIHSRLAACSGAFAYANSLKDAQAHFEEKLNQRDRQVGRLEEALVERSSLLRWMHTAVAERDSQIATLTRSVSELRGSLSWRMTAPLRLVLDVTRAVAGRISIALRAIGAIRGWFRMPPKNVVPVAVSWEGDYVADTPPTPGFTTDIRLVAFYLPQFHPIPENDKFWGRGFTEWNNVTAAKPQFEGHYQPHLPDELGFYDLRVKDVQKRQVELARRYGVGAFCFYLYWFGGKRLLELPVRQFLDNPDLDFPFCLCWANENWTRRWDGQENEILIAQNHSAADDIEFLAYVAEYMKDHRYLHVNGRPVLLVYQPALLPDARATAMRWREWARRNGLGELYLMCPQSHWACDPADYGFDAATEFPPSFGRMPLTSKDLIRPHGGSFQGQLFDWRTLLEGSRHYVEPAYKLFRGVCPSWDNSPRRQGLGSVLLNSSPQGYREWLTNAAADTRRRFQGDERLIFVNAWNEWAEGAHLEPDRRYGYAWLRATREALSEGVKAAEAAERPRLVVVTHDAHLYGAQTLALNMVRELTGSLRCEVEMVCLGDGPLKAEFANCAQLHDLTGIDPEGPEARQLAADLFARGFVHAIVNSTASGLFLGTLQGAGVRCVALVHELRQMILNYQLQKHAEIIAEHADCVVFPAPEVRDAFSEFAPVGEDKVLILPQGLPRPHHYTDEDRARARRAVRHELRLPDDARVILGVGSGYWRKGIDHFVDVASRVAGDGHPAHFVWIGKKEPEMDRQVAALTGLEPGLSDRIHFLEWRDNLPAYYAGADLFALTSREDPFPTVVLLAMDAGLPVVAFAGSGGCNALVDLGLGENVPMGDVEAFAGAVRRILSDSAARARSAEVGPALISQRFSFRHYLFELLRRAGVPVRTVSVVVPSYNYERYLAKRISTILAQTYPLYEVIVLDDASRDNSVEVAGRLLKDSGIDYRIVRNEINSGSVFLQWQRGAELARGEIVWIAEADDLSDPPFLRTVLRAFDDPGVVLSYCESRQIDEHGGVLADNYHDYVADLGPERWTRSWIADGDEEIRRYLAVKNTIPNVSAVLMRREKLVHVLREHIDEIRSYRVAGDWRTYLLLLAGGRLAYFPESLNQHRRHRHGVTISSFDESLLGEIEDMQAWVADHYALFPGAGETARRYLETLRESWRLTGASPARASSSAGGQ
jgi:glycosyltransferase involved in cell wall biosynthesis